MTAPDKTFVVPDDYRAGVEQEIEFLLGMGDRDTAQVIIGQQTVKHPAFGAALAERYAGEPAR